MTDVTRVVLATSSAADYSRFLRRRDEVRALLLEQRVAVGTSVRLGEAFDDALLGVVDVEPVTEGTISASTAVILTPPVALRETKSPSSTPPAVPHPSVPLLPFALPFPLGSGSGGSSMLLRISALEEVAVFHPESAASSQLTTTLRTAAATGADGVVSLADVEKMGVALPLRVAGDQMMTLVILGRAVSVLIVDTSLPALITKANCITLLAATALSFRNIAAWAASCGVPTSSFVELVASHQWPAFVIPIDSASIAPPAYSSGAVAVDGRALLLATAAPRPQLLASAAALELRPTSSGSRSQPSQIWDEALRSALRSISESKRALHVGDLIDVVVRAPSPASVGDVVDATVAELIQASKGEATNSGSGEDGTLTHYFFVERIEATGTGGATFGSVIGDLDVTEVRLKERPTNVFGVPRGVCASSAFCRALESLRVFASLGKELQSGLSRRSLDHRLALTIAVAGPEARESGALPSLVHVARRFGCPMELLDARAFVGDAGGAAGGDEDSLAKAIAALVAPGEGPLIVAVRHAETLSPGGGVARLLRGDAVSAPQGAGDSGDESQASAAVVLFFEGADAPSPALLALSTVEPIRVSVPDDAERAAVAAAILPFAASCSRRCGDFEDIARDPHPLAAQLHVGLALSAEALASWCVGMSFSDICAWLTQCVVDRVASGGGSAATAIPTLSDSDCERVLKAFQQAHGHDLTSTKLQPVRWSDVGGLEDAKRTLLEAIQLPILHPELFGAGGAKRSAGILLYGPPGCGKTLLAKAVATEMSMNFMSVKGPELINMYVGESERNIRVLFQRARDSSPCVVFFDELDALAPSRGAKGDSGGVMDRIVAQLLAEIDGVGSAKSDGTPSSVFIVAATNRPDLLDPSLLRPGRFDRLCYLGVPATKAEQLFAVRALTRKFHLAPDVDLPAVVAPMDFVYTGADFFALCSDAMMMAVEEVVAAATARFANSVTPESGSGEKADNHFDGGADASEVLVEQRHFLDARAALRPSVTPQELQKYLALRKQFEQ